MKNKRVTIVGGAGFIGRNVVKRLAARGAQIAVASPHAVQAGFLRPMGDVGQIATIDVGFGEETTLARLIDGSDIVISAAGTFNAARMDLVHHRGPAMLARLAARSGARHFLHISALGADESSIPPIPAPRPKARPPCAPRSRPRSSSGPPWCSGPRTISSTGSARWRA